MSLDFSTIKIALALWARTETNLTHAIWADQDAPQPYNDDKLKASDAYIILRYTLTEQVGEDYMAPPVDAISSAIITGNREFTLFIEIKGRDAMVLMNKLLDSFQKPGIQETLFKSKIIYVDNFPINNITGLDDTRYIERTSMDVRFRTESIILDDTVGIIDNTEVTGTIKDQVGNIVYNKTVPIGPP